MSGVIAADLSAQPATAAIKATLFKEIGTFSSISKSVSD
jgi:hypothetical protein